MQQHNQQKLKFLITGLPVISVVFIIVLAFIFHDHLTSANLYAISPKSPILAALFLMLLFALKSLTIVVPILVPYGLGGMLFEPGSALILNVVGTFIMFSIPYSIGYLSGGGLIDTIMEKYPKVNKIVQFQQDKEVFFSFMLRFVGIISCDLISLYCGASKMNYKNYIFGAMLGMIPQIVLCTFLGVFVLEPGGRGFIVTVILKVLFLILSFVIYKNYTKEKNGK